MFSTTLPTPYVTYTTEKPQLKPNRISKHQVLTQICFVTSGGTWVKARGLKDRNPFTQEVGQQVTYVRLQKWQSVTSRFIQLFHDSLRIAGGPTILGREHRNMAQWCNVMHKENRSTGRKPCLRLLRSPQISTRTDLRSNQGLAVMFWDTFLFIRKELENDFNLTQLK